MSGAVPSPAARPPERAARVPRPVCAGCGRCGRVDPAPAPQRAPLRAGVARCGGGGRASPGGVPSTVVRGAWCQALSLPRPLVLRSVQPGFCDPCVPGAVDAGVWTQHRPHSVRPCGPALLAVGVAEGRPRGGCLPPLWGAPGVRRCPSPGRSSSAACSQGSATRVSRVRSMRACGPSTGPTACALAGRRCSLWGWRKGVPGGGALHRCEGRLVSGAVPLPAARPPERAARVLRPVCPGCGRCGHVDPAPAPQRAPLRAGVARCGGGGRASPGGVPSTVVRGAWCQALSLPRPLVLRSVQPGFRDTRVPGAVDAGVWTQHRPHSVRPCGPALLAVGMAEGRPRGGVPSTVVWGAWCQALSLPRPLVLRSVQPGFRDPCVPGAVDAGVWTQHRPHSVRPCGPALLAVGLAEGRPRGGCLPPLWGAPDVRRCPSPGRSSSGACSQGSATRVSRVRSMRACGPSTSPTACALAGRRCSLWGWRKGVPGGGAPSTVVRGAWCQALSLPRPPVLRSMQPGFRDPRVPGAVGAGVGTQHRPHSVRPCGPALLAVGVAEGRPRGGCLPPL